MGLASDPAGHIRTLTTADRALFRDHLRRLDEDARRDRFAMGTSEAFLDRYADSAWELDTVQFGFVAQGTVRAVAELRLVGDREAEATFTVEPAWRRRGIGTALMRRLLDAARGHRVRRLYMSCLARNRAIQELARKFEAEVVYEGADVLGLLDEPGAAEAPSFATAVIDIGPRWFGRLSRRDP